MSDTVEQWDELSTVVPKSLSWAAVISLDSIRVYVQVRWFPCVSYLHFFSFLSGKWTEICRIINSSLIIISLYTSHCYFLCMPKQQMHWLQLYLWLKLQKKNASVSVYLLLNPLDCFVCSPSKTQFIPVFLWTYIPCSTFPILSWTVLLLVTLHLVFCFISLPGASQTYYSTLISAICCSVLYDER